MTGSSSSLLRVCNAYIWSVACNHLLGAPAMSFFTCLSVRFFLKLKKPHLEGSSDLRNKKRQPRKKKFSSPFPHRNPIQRAQQLPGNEALRPVAPASQDHPHGQRGQLGQQEGHGEVFQRVARRHQGQTVTF